MLRLFTNMAEPLDYRQAANTDSGDLSSASLTPMMTALHVKTVLVPGAPVLPNTVCVPPPLPMTDVQACECGASPWRLRPIYSAITPIPPGARCAVGACKHCNTLLLCPRSVAP
jgi:hypothetical protein